MFNQFGTPGQTNATFTYHADVLWGGDVTRIPILQKAFVVDGSARDAGNDRPAVLRPGLLFGRVTATGKVKEYDPAATDGTENIIGVNGAELVMTDFLDGQDEDKFVGAYVVAPIKAKTLFIQGLPLVGHPSEAATRVKLRQNFWIDDEF